MQPAGVPYDQEVEPAAGKSMTQGAGFYLRFEIELSCSRALPLKHMERRLRQRACVTGPLHEAATCTLAFLSIILVMLYKVSSPLETRKLQNLPNA